MAGSTARVFTKIILMEHCDMAPLLESQVDLEIDLSYTIGKSIAVLKDGTIIGHLDRMATRLVWRFLRSNAQIEAIIYSQNCGWQLQPWFSILTHSFEMNREDAKLLLEHVTRRNLNHFPAFQFSIARRV